MDGGVLKIGMEPSLFFSNLIELELSIIELERVEFSSLNSNRTEPNFWAFQKIAFFVFLSLKIFLQIFFETNGEKIKYFRKLEISGSRTLARTLNFYELQKPGTKTRVFELELSSISSL